MPPMIVLRRSAAELLDEPGEWYCDRKTTTLYYFPLPGETMLGSEAIIPWHEQIVRLEGDPATGQFVENVTFRGITFANSEWELPRSQPIGSPGVGPVLDRRPWACPARSGASACGLCLRKLHRRPMRAITASNWPAVARTTRSATALSATWRGRNQNRPKQRSAWPRPSRPSEIK